MLTAIIKTAWKFLWSKKVDLPPLPVGLFVICAIVIALGGPYLLATVRRALTPAPPPATVVSVTQIKPFPLNDLMNRPLNIPFRITTYEPKQPEPTVDTCITAPVGLEFALIPTRLGWPVFEVTKDQLKLALWQDNHWRLYEYARWPEKRFKSFLGIMASDWGYGPYIGSEAVRGRFGLSVELGRTIHQFRDVGSPWHVRAGLRVIF